MLYLLHYNFQVSLLLYPFTKVSFILFLSAFFYLRWFYIWCSTSRLVHLLSVFKFYTVFPFYLSLNFNILSYSLCILFYHRAINCCQPYPLITGVFLSHFVLYLSLIVLPCFRLKTPHIISMKSFICISQTASIVSETVKIITEEKVHHLKVDLPQDASSEWCKQLENSGTRNVRVRTLWNIVEHCKMHISGTYLAEYCTSPTTFDYRREGPGEKRKRTKTVVAVGSLLHTTIDRTWMRPDASTTWIMYKESLRPAVIQNFWPHNVL